MNVLKQEPDSENRISIYQLKKKKISANVLPTTSALKTTGASG